MRTSQVFTSLFSGLCAVMIIGVLVQPVHAQTSSRATGSQTKALMSRAGMTPNSPLYFLERFAESIGGIFTPKQSRAQRFLQLAEERLAEASTAASSSSAAQKAITRYRRQQSQAFQAASSSRQTAVLARVASSTTKHFSVLDRVQSQVPQQAKDAIRQAKQASVQGHLSALNALARRKPEQAAEIAMQAAEGRLQAAKREVGGKGGIQDVQSSVQTYQQYTQFGQQISKLAQGIQSGTSSPQDIVNRATKRHRKVLQNIQRQVPQEAQAGIQKALENNQAIPSPRTTDQDNRSNKTRTNAQEAGNKSNSIQESVEEAVENTPNPGTARVLVTVESCSEQGSPTTCSVQVNKVFAYGMSTPSLTTDTAMRVAVQSDRVNDRLTVGGSYSVTLRSSQLPALKSPDPSAPQWTITEINGQGRESKGTSQRKQTDRQNTDKLKDRFPAETPSGQNDKTSQNDSSSSGGDEPSSQTNPNNTPGGSY